MNSAEKADLLDWIAAQPRLCIEEWHHAGGKKSVSVWTIFDDEDTPSGRAPTAIAALKKAKKVSDGLR